MEQDDKLQISFIGLRRSAKLLKPSTGNRLSRLMKLPAIMHIFSMITKLWRMQFLLSKSTIAEMKTTSC
jgi:hypothetical protein